MFRCGDHDALVSYVYEECSPAERARVQAHLDGCPACAEELRALAATREHLLVWSPPEVPLGVRVPLSGAGDEAAPSVRWWVRPLPAWAQAAAAGLIFAAGLSIGASRGEAPVPVAQAPAAAEAPTAAEARTAAEAQTAGGISPDLLAGIEARVRADLDERVRAVVAAEVAALRRAAAAPAARVEQENLLRRDEVEALIALSEERQRLGFAAGLGVAREALLTLEAQQHATLEQVVQQRFLLDRLSGHGEAIGSFASRR